MPWETSVVERMWTRSGEDDPGSSQARMMSSPVRVPVIATLCSAAVAAALSNLQLLDQFVQAEGGR